MEAALAVKFGGSFRLNKWRQVLHEYRGSSDQLFLHQYPDAVFTLTGSFHINIHIQFLHKYIYRQFYKNIQTITEAVFASIDGGGPFFVSIRYTKAVFP